MLQSAPLKSVAEFARSVALGLGNRPRQLSPKFFYDKIGSALFEEITRQPEYYLTRTEAAILKRHAPEIAAVVGERVSLVELGSGSSTKTRILLESLLENQRRLRYLPIDISPSMLRQTARELDARYPEVHVTPIASQYESGLRKASCLVAGRDDEAASMLVLFLGSSIGNMEPDEAVDFLSRVRGTLDRRDALLVGFDLVKDESVIDAAYNDGAGVTARFNLNLLARINRELGGEFELDRFSHLAFFKRESMRIEMHLVSELSQEVWIAALGRGYRFEPGETIHTENSYKYTLSSIEELAAAAGWNLKEVFSDDAGWFALSLLVPA